MDQPLAKIIASKICSNDVTNFWHIEKIGEAQTKSFFPPFQFIFDRMDYLNTSRPTGVNLIREAAALKGKS